MADTTNEHEPRARARKAAKLYRALRSAGATAQTVRSFSFTDWMNAAKAAGTYSLSETTIAQVTELLESADAMDRAVKAAEARADPFEGLALDEQWATA